MNEQAIKLGSIGWITELRRKISNYYRPSRTHDYSRLTQGIDYVFEYLPGTTEQGYMTAQRRGVRLGDRIILMQDGTLQRYAVQELSYYSSPSDMWIARLTVVD